MRRTLSSTDNTAPRPIGQSFWLLSTMAIAAMVLMTMSSALPAVSDTPSGSAYSGQQLLDLASSDLAASGDTSSSFAASGDTSTTVAPAAPAVADTTTSSAASSSTTASTVASAPSSTAPSSTVAPSTTAPADVTTTTAADTSTTASETEPAPSNIEAKGQAALNTISYPWQTLLPGWTITFLPEKSGLYGLTMVPERKIEVYVRESQSTELLAHVIAHELGHAVDVSLNDGPDRRRWEDARGLDSAPWWPGNGATDFSTGAGDFAESFAAWQVGDASFRSKLGGAPTTEQITLLAELSAG